MASIPDPVRRVCPGGVVGMRTPLIVVTESLRDDVLAAVIAVKKPTSIYVSRGMLESELADHPEKYPSLSRASQAFRRQAILNDRIL